MRALLKVGFSLLVLACVLVALSYSMLRANGTTATSQGRQVAREARAVPDGVDAVALEGPIDLTLRYGATPALHVSGEQRLLGNVEVTQEGPVLHIGIRGMVLRHRQPLEVELVLPALTAVTLSGNGDSTVNGFSGERIAVQLNGSGSARFNGRFRRVEAGLSGNGDLDVNAGAAVDRFEVRLMGSGSMTVVGNARELDAESSGSGRLDAEHLRAETVMLSQTGSGDSVVQAHGKASMSISGSGDVEVHGNPGERSTSRTGTGSVSYVE